MKSTFIFSLRNFQRKKIQTLAICLCLFLSVGLCSLVALFSSATIHSFEKSVDNLSSDTDLIITLDDTGFSADLIDTVLDLKEVESAVPLLKQKVFVGNGTEKKMIMTFIGIDLLNEENLSKSSGKNAIKDPLSFMANPLSVALPAKLLEKKNLKVGNDISVLTPGGKSSLLVNASFQEEDFTQVFGSNLAIMDIEAARIFFKREGKIDQINIKLKDNRNLPLMIEKIRASMGMDYLISPPSQLVDNLKSTVKPFQLILFFMAGLTFILVFYLLMNLSANTLNERRKEMGVLRALGCSKIRLASLVYGEFSLMALCGSFAGALSAWILAPLLGGKLNSFVGAQYGMSIDLKPSDFDVRYALVIALVGSLIVVMGITKSVWRILQVSPVEAISPLTIEDEKIRNVDYKSFLYFMVSIIPLFVNTTYPFIYIIPLIGAILFGPSVIVLFLRSLGHIKSLQQSKVGRLAWEYSKADPKSVGKKTRGIMIGLMAIFMIAMVQTSFEEALMGRFVHTSRPDMFVTANGNLTSPLQLQPLEEELAPEIEKIQGVLGAYGERVVKVLYKNQSLTLRAIDEVPPDNVRLKSPYSYFDIVDRSTVEAGHDLYHGVLEEINSLNIFASETLATNLGVKTGDSLDFASPNGNVKAKIVGIVRDLSAGNGVVYIGRDHYKKWWNDPLLSGFGLAIDEKADPNLIKSQIEDAFSEKYGVVVTLDKKLKTDIMKVVGRAFYFMGWIEALIIFVALLNFMTTFLFDIKGRTKQFATLRSMGMPKTDLIKMVILETLFLTVTSTTLAYLLALPFSWRMIGTGITSSLGWYIGFHFDGMQSLSLIALSISVISLAGIIPAMKASSIEIASSLRSE